MGAAVRDTAWPFLIGRTKTCDYRLIAVPAFMAGTAMATALRDGTGGGLSAPGTALAREIPVSRRSSVTAVYAVHTAHAEEYGLPLPELSERGPLVDASSRPILLTEGLVIRRSMKTVVAAGVSTADLERAHDLTAPAYRAFWEEEDQFTQQAMDQFEMLAVRPGTSGVKIYPPS